MTKRKSEKLENSQHTSRRKTLKNLGMGSAIVTVSGVWQKPVVNSVILPAHAQTTEVELY